MTDLPLGLLEDVVDVVDAGDPVVADLDLLGEIIEQRFEALGLEGPGDDVRAGVDGLNASGTYSVSSPRRPPTDLAEGAGR
ncbi:MAG: hypothetical protein OXC25_10685 [Thiotrichales bacterium]|nr:hypothetical protein [Thiotrichales bacterium]MCY4350297.1 hypothetical protein [Thiotrichales bacterium]